MTLHMNICTMVSNKSRFARRWCGLGRRQPREAKSRPDRAGVLRKARESSRWYETPMGAHGLLRGRQTHEGAALVREEL